MPTIRISTTVSLEFYEIAKKLKIKWAEAMRMGLSMIFAERGISKYDNNLNVVRKMNLFREKAENALQELVTLKEKLK